MPALITSLFIYLLAHAQLTAESLYDTCSKRAMFPVWGLSGGTKG